MIHKEVHGVGHGGYDCHAGAKNWKQGWRPGTHPVWGLRWSGPFWGIDLIDHRSITWKPETFESWCFQLLFFWWSDLQEGYSLHFLCAWIFVELPCLWGATSMNYTLFLHDVPMAISCHLLQCDHNFFPGYIIFCLVWRFRNCHHSIQVSFLSGAEVVDWLSLFVNRQQGQLMWVEVNEEEGLVLQSGQQPVLCEVSLPWSRGGNGGLG